MKRLLGVLMAILMLVTLSACGGDSSAKSGVEDGVLTIAMECAYAPYNWTQTDDSNGAVPIKGTNDYANGYDIMIAKRICEANGWELEVVRSDWDSLVPSVQTGVIDAVIAGQSMTKERSQQVDFAGPYYYASFAILVKKDSPLANATSIMDFAGYKGSAQSATIWYSECLPQMEGALIQTAAESAPGDGLDAFRRQISADPEPDDGRKAAGSPWRDGYRVRHGVRDAPGNPVAVAV